MINKKEIDKQVKKYYKGKLSEAETKSLVYAIKTNPVTRQITVNGFMSQGKLNEALSLIKL